MRLDNENFDLINKAEAKSPRYTIEIAFDDAYTDLYHITSHSDSATPPAATIISSAIEGLAVTSQKIKPEKALAEIGNISFTVTDVNNQIRAMQASELAFGNSLRGKRIRVYMGYEGLIWADYILVQTQIIDSVTYKDGGYNFICSDIQRLERRDIFDLAKTNLSTSISATATTIIVANTAEFESTVHNAYWSDAPNQTVYYFKIDDEVIRATGKTSTTFTNCVRGRLNTKAVEHTIDPSVTIDKRTVIDEYVYLEMPAAKMCYELLTGALNIVPTSWHLGIPTEYVRFVDFTGIGLDIWDSSDEAVGSVARFEGEEKQDGKKFIETQINLSMACFNIVYSTGELGLRRITNVISDAPHVLELNENNVVSYSKLTHDMSAVKNKLKFLWNYLPTKRKYNRRNTLFDSISYNLHGSSNPEIIKLRGVHGSIHTSAHIDSIFDSFRDRYSDPPLRLDVEVLFSNNIIEIADIVKVNLPIIMDYNTDDSINRSFEVQRMTIDWIKGSVKLSLFGSAAKAGAIIRSGLDTTTLSNNYYTQAGNNLKTYIGGGYDATTDYSANHIISNCQLTGNDSLASAASIYYHEGDLTIDVGVTVNITKNVKLLVAGFLTINGTISGAGAANATEGVSGFVGSAESQGGLYYGVSTLDSGEAGTASAQVLTSFKSTTYNGKNNAVPEIQNLEYDSSGEILIGLPTDLRGTRGDKGGNLKKITYDNWQSDKTDLISDTAGGNSGDAGAGLLMINRGVGFGANGKIDLSGGDGSAGTIVDMTLGFFNSKDTPMSSGGGAGGSSGSLYLLMDGKDSLATFDNTNLILCRGNVPYILSPMTESSGVVWDHNKRVNRSGFYVGIDNGCQFSAHHRVQYIPSVVAVEPDIPDTLVVPPTSLSALSGTDQLLLEPDGTVIPRVLLSWVAAIDIKVAGYEVQYKPSSGSIWISSTNVLGADNTQGYIFGVTSNTTYDFRVRSAAGNRTSSDWLTMVNHIVLGKSEPPDDVTGFIASQNGEQIVFKWNEVLDVDLSGYQIRYASVLNADYGSALILTETAKGTELSSSSIPPANYKFFIKAKDTSGNFSINAAEITLNVITKFDLIYSNDEHPTWLGNRYGFDIESDALVPTRDDVAEYVTNEYDLGFDDIVRIWANISASLSNVTSKSDYGRIPNSVTTASNYGSVADAVTVTVDYGVLSHSTGGDAVSISYEIATRKEGDVYRGADFVYDYGLVSDAAGITEDLGFITDEATTIIIRGSLLVFKPWGIGDVDMRYITHRIRCFPNSSGNLPVILEFTPTIDLLERNEKAGGKTVSIGGSRFDYDKKFHLTPFVTPSIKSSSALFAVKSNEDASGFDVSIYNSSGTDVGLSAPDELSYIVTGV